MNITFIKILLENELKAAIKQRKIEMMKNGEKYLKSYVLPDRTIKQFPANESVPYQEIMLLCVSEKGKMIMPWSFPNCCVEVIREELCIELSHAHCLRYTHGTILAENGVNPKTVMERLGHKDIATTLGKYTFNTESMKNSAVDVFENAVNR